jgi:FkbM family methyltransferase
MKILHKFERQYQPKDWLNEVLSESIEDAIKRRNSAFSEIFLEKNKKVILFGAGSIGRKLNNYLRSEGIKPIAFVDNDSTKQSTIIDGTPVFSPAEAVAMHGNQCLFIITAWSAKFSFREAKSQLEKLDVKNVVHGLFLMWSDSAQLLPNYALDYPEKILKESEEIKKAFSLLADVESREIFLEHLQLRLFGDFEAVQDPQPWPPQDLFKFNEREVIVDGGAFDGDTIVDFFDGFGTKIEKIYAVEPDPKNYQNLLKRTYSFSDKLSKKINPLQIALGSQQKKVLFESSGSMSSNISENGKIIVSCETIDALFSKDTPTYIKLDIEGGELEALRGAHKTLMSSNTVWSVTTEHTYNDLWRIPNLINSVNPKLNIFIRSHGFEGWDLICYAVPSSRVNTLDKAISL